MKGFFTDKILLARLKSQDQAAFTELYDRYVDKVYRFIYFKVGDQPEAEDLTAAAFLKVWQHLGQHGVTDIKTLPALVYRIARNVVIDHYRQSSKVETVSADSEEARAIPDLRPDPHQAAETASDLARLERQLHELKDEYREVLVLKHVNELSIGEIAEVLGKSKGNVRVLIYRATAALKELAGKENKE